MNNTAKAMKTYTWDDYRTWPDNQRWEIIGGEAHAMSPSPTEMHQTIQVNIVAALRAFLRGHPCRAYAAPFDVKLSDTNVVQPDVLVVCNREQIKRTHIEGPPALVIEILSDSTEAHDRGVKMRLYAAHGVPEVWLVTPYPSIIEVYRLDGKTYRMIATYASPDALKSPGFAKLKLDLKDVFDFPLEPGEKAAMMVRETPPPYGAKKCGRVGVRVYGRRRGAERR